MTARIWVVRHGETDWNVEGRLQGQTDIPLNATGRAQADALAETLSARAFSRLVSSDLARALQTAGPLAARLALEVRTDAALRERAFGIFEGMTWDEVAARQPEWHARYRADPTCDIPGAEPLPALRARSWEVLSRHAASTLDDEATLLVTHGGVVRSMLVHLLGDRAPRPVANAVPYVFVARAGIVVDVELP